jgi:hypothetical protein
MTGGYVVADSPDGAALQPGTPTHPGTGQAAAATWLNRLRVLAHRTCVAPLPYAQADLDAVQRVGDAGLSAIATSSAGDIVDQILGVTAVRGATLIPDGSLTRGTVKLLSANGNSVVVAPADFSSEKTSATSAAADTAPRRLSPQVVVAPFDPAVGAAFAATGSDPVAPTYLNAALAVRLQHDSETARRQDAEIAVRRRGRHPEHAGDRDPFRAGGAAAPADAHRRRISHSTRHRDTAPFRRRRGRTRPVR